MATEDKYLKEGIDIEKIIDWFDNNNHIEYKKWLNDSGTSKKDILTVINQYITYGGDTRKILYNTIRYLK